MKLTAKVSQSCSLVTLVFAILSLSGCEIEDASLHQAEVPASQPTGSARSTRPWRHPVVQYATTAIIPVSLGNQTVDLMPDTGSFDVLVTSVLCKECGSADYKATKSPNFHLESPIKSRTFHFGSGNLEALSAFDRFVAGPYDVKQMPMWLIRKLSPELYDAFDSSEMQGVLGLGLSRSTAAQEMGIRQFSLCLHTFKINSWWNGGVMYWNGREESLDWSSPIPTDGDFHWQLRTDGVRLGQTQVCGAECSAIVDSGTSILAVPRPLAARLEQALPRIADDCDLVGLPDLQVSFAHGVSLSLPPSAYVMKFRDLDDLQKFSSLAHAGLIVWRRPTPGTLCAPVLQVTSSTSWVLGMPLFRAYAASFDRLAKTISFARNEGGTCKEDSTTAFMLHPGKSRHIELDSAMEIPAAAFVASLQRRASHRLAQTLLGRGPK